MEEKGLKERLKLEMQLFFFYFVFLALFLSAITAYTRLVLGFYEINDDQYIRYG